MKPAIGAMLLLSAAALGLWWSAFHTGKEVLEPSVVTKVAEPPPSSVSTEALDVFRKAFWGQPGAGDKILHAERREWADEQGLQKWQWFIVVEPSPELLKRLRDDNVFGLVQDTSPPSIPNPPEWFQFPSADAEFMTSNTGNFRLILSKSGRRIHASDWGNGFRSGAPDPVTESITPGAVESPASGRLPNSMPLMPTPKSR